jgi:Ser/Thr protein kinase RdoA (MazF antagonist)
MLFDETHLSLFPAERKNVYQKAIDWVQESIDRLIAGGEKMRILHGDLHQWNVRNARGRLSPIDFEDLMFGWPVQDIATTLYYFPTEQYASLRSAFQAGYVRCIPWPERYAGEIASFIAARGIGLVNFVLGDFPAGREQQAEEFVAKTEKQLRALMSMEE